MKLILDNRRSINSEYIVEVETKIWTSDKEGGVPFRECAIYMLGREKPIFLTGKYADDFWKWWSTECHCFDKDGDLVMYDGEGEING